MGDNLLTTIVIPAYNAERFIERTLRSALNQTHRNLEIIVVDDGSSDNTGAIAQALSASDSRLRILRVPNGGVAKARNIGIDQASGKFVAFLDADDLWHPNKIELQVAALNSTKGGEAAAVYPMSRLIDANDRVIRSTPCTGFSGYAFARHLNFKPVGNGSSILVRREIAAGIGGFDSTFAAEGIGGCEDLDFELRIAAEYALLAIPEYLVGYRTHPGNMSSDTLRMSRAMVATITRHIEQHPELPSFAARNARAAACEYAVTSLISGRYWTLAALQSAALLRFDFRRGLNLGTSILKGVLSRRLLRVKRAIRMHVSEPASGPHFCDLSPKFDSSDGAMWSRDPKLMDHLEIIDAFLAKKARYHKPASSGYYLGEHDLQ